MTLIAVWSDSPKEHVYIGSDSRLSGIGNASVTWDHATKIFQIAGLPEVVAYCGKTEPLLNTIAQSVSCIRYTEHLASAGAATTPQLESRLAGICNHLADSFKSYPDEWMAGGGTMFFAGFDSRLGKPRVIRVSMSKKGVEWTRDGNPQEPDEIDFAKPVFFGSGKATAEGYLAKGKSGFDCLKSTIMGERNETVGGVPQVVRISRSGVMPLGFVLEGRPYLGGMELFFRSGMTGVEWRDISFRVTPYPLKAQVTRI